MVFTVEVNLALLDDSHSQTWKRKTMLVSPLGITRVLVRVTEAEILLSMEGTFQNGK